MTEQTDRWMVPLRLRCKVRMLEDCAFAQRQQHSWDGNGCVKQTQVVFQRCQKSMYVIGFYGTCKICGARSRPTVLKALVCVWFGRLAVLAASWLICIYDLWNRFQSSHQESSVRLLAVHFLTYFRASQRQIAATPFGCVPSAALSWMLWQVATPSTLCPCLCCSSEAIVGRQLAIIGDDIQRQYERRFAEMMKEMSCSGISSTSTAYDTFRATVVRSVPPAWDASRIPVYVAGWPVQHCK